MAVSFIKKNSKTFENTLSRNATDHRRQAWPKIWIVKPGNKQMSVTKGVVQQQRIIRQTTSHLRALLRSSGKNK